MLVRHASQLLAVPALSALYETGLVDLSRVHNPNRHCRIRMTEPSRAYQALQTMPSTSAEAGLADQEVFRRQVRTIAIALH